MPARAQPKQVEILMPPGAGNPDDPKRYAYVIDLDFTEPRELLAKMTVLKQSLEALATQGPKLLELNAKPNRTPDENKQLAVLDKKVARLREAVSTMYAVGREEAKATLRTFDPYEMNGENREKMTLLVDTTWSKKDDLVKAMRAVTAYGPVTPETDRPLSEARESLYALMAEGQRDEMVRLEVADPRVSLWLNSNTKRTWGPI